jgi:hypothetical protein
MAAVGLSHYNIKAPLKQLEELRDFYCKIVGLGDYDSFNCVGLVRGSTNCLSSREIPAGMRARRPSRPRGRL